MENEFFLGWIYFTWGFVLLLLQLLLLQLQNFKKCNIKKDKIYDEYNNKIIIIYMFVYFLYGYII